MREESLGEKKERLFSVLSLLSKYCDGVWVVCVFEGR